MVEQTWNCKDCVNWFECEQDGHCKGELYEKEVFTEEEHAAYLDRVEAAGSYTGGCGGSYYDYPESLPVDNWRCWS